MSANNNSDEILSLHDRCTRELPTLYLTITKLMAGEKTVRMRTSDAREVEFTNANLDAALKMYSHWYKMCGQDSSYPDLATAMPQGLTRRGPPAQVGGC